MEQLSDVDYATLQMESPRLPQHISGVMFYDQSRVESGGVSFENILRVFESALHKSTLLRRKLGGSSGGFDTPYWVDDPDLDLEYHVRHIRLPEPGDWRELCIMLSRLHSQALDMTRPPWEAYVIEGIGEVEGLPADGFVIMLKIHHSAADGIAVVELLKKLHSPDENPEPPPVSEDWKSEPYPTRQQVWSNALRNAARRPAKMIEILRKVVPRVMEARRNASKREEAQPGVRTRFNTRISSQRVVDAVILDLDRVKRIRRAVKGVSVNDVILSVVGGALRKYLLAKGELPDTPITAGQAVSLRAPEEDKSRGNKVGIMRVSLATDVEDPLERLRVVAQSNREAKERAAAMGTREIMDLVESMGPLLVGAGVKLQGLGLERSSHALPYQAGVTNIPGPQAALYMAGARLHMLMCMVPLMDGMGLANCVMSCADQITITAVGCRELLPDPEFYRECLQHAWDALESAAGAK